jgi:hypothetical protein
MAIRALIHILSEDSVLCELDEMPDPSHHFIRVRNATRRDGKPMDLVDNRTTSIAYPWSRITFVEFFNEDTAKEAVVGFFRERA